MARHVAPRITGLMAGNGPVVQPLVLPGVSAIETGWIACSIEQVNGKLLECHLHAGRIFADFCLIINAIRFASSAFSVSLSIAWIAAQPSSDA